MKFLDFENKLINTWNDFEENTTHITPFDQLSWKKNWIEHFGNDYQGELIFNDNFFAPIKIKNKIASFIGSKDLVDYNNFLSNDDSYSSFDLFLQEVFKLDINSLILDSISEDSLLFNVLSDKSLKSKFNILIEEEDVAPFLILPESWDEYLMSLNKKRRHEIKRKIRRLEENVDFSSGDLDSISDKDEILEDFFRLHKLSSEEKKTFMNKKREEFFTDLILDYINKESLLYSYLKISNKTVACSISFTMNNNRYLYNSGFDPEYIKHSSGLLNHVFAIKRSIENKFNIFDFMRGNERYKYDLGGVDKKVFSIHLEKK
ncbi:MAG: GNAT family N-acetyltransferase [Dehalococcoidales bacterium]|nr:GNAT family N-acetyltransferase [Dehalococcoidia bacterium]NCG35410.1 GNAT family N-acetyltransferase [Dehalococcoidales bacterium]